MQSIADSKALYDSVEESEKEFVEKLRSKRIAFFKDNKSFADDYAKAFRHLILYSVSAKNLDEPILKACDVKRRLCTDALAWFRSAHLDFCLELDKGSFSVSLERLKERIDGYEKDFVEFNIIFFAFAEHYLRQESEGFRFRSVPLLREKLDLASSRVNRIYLDWFNGTVVGAGVVKKKTQLDSFESVELA